MHDGDNDGTPFDAALTSIVEAARNDEAIEGVLVSGSYVNGALGPYSDLDVYMLLRQSACAQSGWETHVVCGVEVEVTRDTFEGYRRVLGEKGRIREVIHPLAVGHIVFDEQQSLATLQTQARNAIQELSARVDLDADARQALARPLLFGFRKIGNARFRKDWIRFNSELGFLLHLLPGLVLSLSGRRIAPAPIECLRKDFPGLYEQYALCLRNPDREQKWRSLNDLLGTLFVQFSLGILPEPLLDGADDGA